MGNDYEQDRRGNDNEPWACSARSTRPSRPAVSVGITSSLEHRHEKT